MYGVTLQAPLALSVRAASNLFISVVGAGVLGLPYAFRRSGLIQGIVVMIVIAALNLHCMLLLVMPNRARGHQCLIDLARLVSSAVTLPHITACSCLWSCVWTHPVSVAAQCMCISVCNAIVGIV